MATEHQVLEFITNLADSGQGTDADGAYGLK